MDLAGTVVGHVRLQELVGRGGMGDVYRGFDEFLQRRVAVKVIAPQRRLSDEYRARFRREAQVLACFQHPGICQVFDFVEGSQADFLIMEFLEGETLKVCAPGLSAERRLEVAERIADVLGAAHAAGIVHRDLKPENVMVLPSGDVKVLDFGLARVSRLAEDARHGGSPAVGPPPGTVGGEQSSAAASYTTDGMLVGTLQYMSPEQARGESATAASDMFAFGVLVHELVTGKPAYGDDVTFPVLLQRVSEARLEPCDAADVDLSDLIAALTRREASARPTAREAAERLRAVRSRPVREAQRRRRLVAAAVAVLAVTASAVMSFVLARPKPWVPAGESSTLAVVPFVNATGDASLDWVRDGLPEMVVHTLGASGVRAVPVADVSRVMGSLGLESLLDVEQARRLEDALGARLLVSVEASRRGRTLVLAYTVFDHERVRAKKTLEGYDLTELAGVLASRLTQRLLPSAAVTELSDTFSEDPFANSAYAIAVSTLATAGPKKAALYFQVALDRDPALVMASLGLARCRELEGDWDEAETLVRAALEEARNRSLPEAEGTGLRQLGRIEQLRGNFDEAGTSIEAALTLARRRGDGREEADCLNELGRLELRRRRYPAALRYFEGARTVFEATGDNRGSALVLNNLGLAHWRMADLDAARELFEAGLASARTSFNRDLQLSCLTNLGGLALQQSRLDEAEAAFDEAVTLGREVGNNEAVMSAYSNLAAVAFYRHDLSAAEKDFRELLTIHRQRGDRVGQATALANLASVTGAAGKGHDARALGEEALAIRRELGDVPGQGRVLATLAEVARKEGESDEARRLYLEARDRLREGGDRAGLASALVGLGFLAVERGRPAEAAGWLREARAVPASDDLLRLLEAAVAFGEGRWEDAVRLQLAAREAMGESWGEDEEAALAKYREAAGKGNT